MRMNQRLRLVAFVLALALPISWLLAAPRPRPAPAPLPIEVAFGKIRKGMSPEDLFALMAPYKKQHSGHYQWQSWREGKNVVTVTIWPDDATDGFLRGDTYRVQEMSMFRVVVEDGRER
jgi:hypothetical protein